MQEITEDEVLEALQKGAPNKCPGPDGFPLEFYQSFQTLMAPRWTVMYRELMSPAVPLPPAFVEGMIIPIHKPHGGAGIQDYRPLTLLNCDFKIFTRILAARFKGVLRLVLSLDQTSLGGDSNIQTALSDYRDVIALATTCRLRGALVSVDFSSAFDRVSHAYLATVMTHMNFPQDFVTVVMRLLRGASSKVLVNGRMMGPIKISRSVRQGCPLSTILYAIALEPLLCGLRNRLSGLTLRGHTFICRAYADDLVFMARSSEEVQSALHWITKYGTATGSCMNMAKSGAMAIGRGLPDGSVAPLKTMDTMKCLGIIFTNDVHRTAALNYKRLLQTTRTRVRDNRLRALNMIQRVVFVNTHLASRIPHLAQVLPMPVTIARRLLAAFGYFVSTGLLFKVRYETLTLPVTRGGLGLVNVRERAVALYVGTMIKMWSRHQTSFSGTLIEELAPPSRLAPVAVSHISPSLSHIRTFFVEYSYVYTELPNTRTAAARDIYRLLQQRHPSNIVEQRHPSVRWSVVWRSVHHLSLDTETRAMWYVLVNGKHVTRSRLHTIHMSDTPLCPHCNVMDTDEHRLVCGPAAEVWCLVQRIIAYFLRKRPSAIEARTLLFPDETYYPRAKTNAVTWIRGLSVFYLYQDGNKSVLDFWTFLQERHSLLLKIPRYRTFYANFLGSALQDPPRSWGVPGMRS